MWWKIFDVVPGWVYALLIVGLGAYSGLQHERLAHRQAEFQTFKAEVADNTRKAEEAARKREQELQANVNKVAQQAQKRQQELAARVTATDSAAVSLRDEIARLNARPVPDNPGAAAYAHEATVARELLGQCAERYKAVATNAEGLTDQVTGLQEYANSIGSP